MKITEKETGASYVLSVDIGGSHITAGICNKDNLTIDEDSIVRVDVDSRTTAAEILDRWQMALLSVTSRAKHPLNMVGVAMPGPFDYPKGISYIKGLNKYEAIYGMDIKQAFAGFLGIRADAVLFRNDAEATIAGEALAGAGRGYGKVAGVTLGTGFGSACCSNGTAVDLNYGSSPFKESIADDYLSTRWFQKRYRELSGKDIMHVKALAALLPHDETAVQVFSEFGLHMAEFLQQPLRQLAPDLLILCGNITRAAGYFLPAFTGGFTDVPVKIAQLGENAALIGAAALFNSKNAVLSNS